MVQLFWRILYIYLNIDTVINYVVAIYSRVVWLTS